jgi:peptidoglycan/xylan/chitin deacetylase (PgdA/CDA1 family)
MILSFHKIDIITPSRWWLTPKDFESQIERLNERTVVFLEDYFSPDKQAVITFDDAYENIVHHALPILASRNLPFEVFVIGNTIGDWNEFDPDEPPTRHMSMCHLEEVVRRGGRLQWHTRSHPNLLRLKDNEIAEELEVPEFLRKRFLSPHFSWLSYPYGSHDDRVVKIAKRTFSGAVSVVLGKPNDRWQMNRVIPDRAV